MWVGDLPWISGKDIDRTILRQPSTFITEEAARAHSRVVPAGSILMLVRGMALAHGLAVVLSNRRTAFNQDVRALVVDRRFEPRFVRYTLLGHRARLEAHIDRAAHGTARVQSSLFSERLPVLAQARQIDASDFLDTESQRIDQFAKELGELARASKEAHLDSSRKLVLGEGWPMVPLKHYARTGTGHTPSRERPDYWKASDCSIPWFTLADVSQIRDGRKTTISSTTERISQVGLAHSAAVKHPADTVILSRTASVGFSALMGVDMAVSQDFMTWTCGPKVEPRYLLVALRAMQPEIRALMHGSTHQTVYMPDLHALRIPLPPLERQQQIATVVEGGAQRLWPMVDELEAMRSGLAEYRDALITEAVIGELDVARLSEQQLDESAHAALEGEQPEVLSA